MKDVDLCRTRTLFFEQPTMRSFDVPSKVQQPTVFDARQKDSKKRAIQLWLGLYDKGRSDHNKGREQSRKGDQTELRRG
jgi:hypothetical protein